MDLDPCPTCGWPAIVGRPCPRCSLEPEARAEQDTALDGRFSVAARGAGARGGAAAQVSYPGFRASLLVIIGLLAFLGLFWTAIGVMEIAGAARLGPGGDGLLVAIVAGCNVLVGAYTLSGIRTVVLRKLTAVGQIAFIAVIGVLWPIVATLWFGGSFQLLAVPLHVGLGALAVLNHRHFNAA
jgi:hypothetical protein